MRKRPLATVCLVMIFFLFIYTKTVQDSPPDFLLWEGNEVTVIGKVYQKETYPKAEKQVSVVYIKLSSVDSGSVRAEVKEGDYRAICYLKSDQTMPETGSIVRASGIMKCFEKATNPGQFDVESYYQIFHISFQLNQTEIQQQSSTYHKGKEVLYQFRCRLSAIFDYTLPQKDASVMKTMLLGEKKAVDSERKALYQRSGIAHILAISALHISLIGMTLFKVLRKIGVPVWLCTVLSMITICLYGSMVGDSVSVIRAVGMFCIHVFGQSIRRSYDMITAIAVMAFSVLVEQPLYLYNSSFLLSFGCVLAIALLIPALTKKRLKKEKEPPQWFGKIVGGVVITASMLPFQMLFFYQIPVYSMLLNLLVIPLMSVLLPAGILLPGMEKISGCRITRLLSYLISGILAIYDGACEICCKLPGALLWTGKPALWKVVCYFVILFLIVIRQRKASLKKKWIALAVAVLFLLFNTDNVSVKAFGEFRQIQGSSECRVTFLDVGQGDCIHIQSGTGKHYLIDGGSSNVESVGKYRILPYMKYYGVREFEAIFVTHPDEDHCNGIIELLELADEEGFVIKRLGMPGIAESIKSEAYRKLTDAAGKAGVPIVYFSKGMSLQDGQMSLQCLHPSPGYETKNENEYSLVFLMNCGEFDAVFTGDVEEEGEEMLIQTLREYLEKNTANGIISENMDVDLLKVAHHGSRYSTTEEFLALLRPEIAVISCGVNNIYKHPHEETLMRLAKAGSKVYSTVESGAITVKIKENAEVQEYKKKGKKS